MKRIASFEVNHDILTPGMYTSRIDGDIITYDIRMTLPNVGPFLENAQMHSFEHLFATYARNSRFAESIIYVGPMGCRTGFYLLVRNTITPAETIELVSESCKFIADFQGGIPGATEKECGNAKEHNLEQANKLGAKMAEVLNEWTVPMLEYRYHE